ILGKERAITVLSRDDPLDDEVASAVQQKATTTDAITTRRPINGRQDAMRGFLTTRRIRLHSNSGGQSMHYERTPRFRRLKLSLWRWDVLRTQNGYRQFLGEMALLPWGKV